MRSSSNLFAFAVAIATLVAGPADAQLPTPEPPVFGVDYSFERTVATRGRRRHGAPRLDSRMDGLAR
jgi:hypothetical protein